MTIRSPAEELAREQFTHALSVMTDVVQKVDVTGYINGLSREELLHLMAGMIYLNGQFVDGIAKGENRSMLSVIQQLAALLLEDE